MYLALLDLDNFKMVNDQFGHWVGDIVLKRVALSIQEGISSNDFASRYGGEEFAVLFIDHSVEDVKEKLENIRLSVSHDLLYEAKRTGKNKVVS
jgi:diguanylate cyclase (GGDEF)-like protein